MTIGRTLALLHVVRHGLRSQELWSLLAALEAYSSAQEKVCVCVLSRCPEEEWILYLGAPDRRHASGGKLVVVLFCVRHWVPCVMEASETTCKSAENNGFAFLTSSRPRPPTHVLCSKAEGTEGEAESRLLRKLLKNKNRLIDSIRQMDVDRDGVISTAEFRAAIVAMNVGLTDRQVEKLIRSIDVDNDGELDMQVLHPYPPSLSRTEQAKKR